MLLPSEADAQEHIYKYDPYVLQKHSTNLESSMDIM